MCLDGNVWPPRCRRDWASYRYHGSFWKDVCADMTHGLVYVERENPFSSRMVPGLKTPDGQTRET